ncbi:MAG: DUF2304 domain-containing protein [Eubacteriales bacterium]|nr:DUF2304 domain-containing protein [Eubacteriales bacterium]
MIDIKIKICAVIGILFIVGVITHFVRKEKITVGYSIVWYLSCLVMILFSIFPEIFRFFSDLIGFEISSNFLFVLLIAFLFFICISLTIIVSEQKEQIRRLIQEISIMKSEREKNL